MKLKVIISTSRNNPQKEGIKELLQLQEEIEEVYDCEDEATAIQGEQSKQEEINEEIIKSFDWFILLAPLNHVGNKTFLELQIACKSLKETGKPIISIFHSSKPDLSIPIGPNDKPYQAILDEIQRIMIEDRKHAMTPEELEASEQYAKDYKPGLEGSSILKELKLLLKKRAFKSTQLLGISKKGSEILARDLYFDKHRAEPKYGFYEDQYLPRKSVDRELEKAIDEEKKLIILTGTPGSGKTRAVYECIRQKLKNDHILLVKTDNVKEVADRMFHFQKLVDKGHQSEDVFYLICDQIRDVFASLEKGKIIDFFEVVINNPNIYFIATTIRTSYNAFLEDLDQLDVTGRMRKYFNANAFQSNYTLCQNIDIPLISDDDESNLILNWLSNNFNTRKGETIGDFIPGLNNYIDSIVDYIYDQVQKREWGQYVEAFIRGMKIHWLFRRTSPDPLFIPIMITRCIHNEEKRENFKSKCVACINYLIDINFITVRRDNELVKLETRNLDLEDENEYDGEEFLTILSPEYTYSVNELVLEALQKIENRRRQNRQKYLFSFFMDEIEDVKKAIRIFYNTFPNAESLRRMVPRLPTYECSEETFKAGKELILKLLRKLIEEKPREIKNDAVKLTFSLLIGRADSWEEVQKLLGEMKKYDIEPDADLIGELYRYGQRQEKEQGYVWKFIETFQEKKQIEDTLYIFLRKMECLTKTFAEAKEFVKEYQILEFIRQYSKQVESIEYMNAQRIFNLLWRREKTPDEYRELLEMYREADMTMDSSDLYTFIHSAYKNKEKLEQIFHILLDENSPYQPQIRKNNFEQIIAFLINESPDFNSAYFFYEENLKHEKEKRQEKDEVESEDRENIDNYRLFAMCLKHANKQDFQKVMECVNAMEKRSKKRTPPMEISSIIYNQLLKIVPTLDDAASSINKITKIDDYTLNNLLLDIISHKDSDEKCFIYAYQLINRSQFKPVRTSIHVIANLFNLATAPGHEKYIFNMIRQDLDKIEADALINMVKSSDEIGTMRIRKMYRNLDKSFQLLTDIRERKKHEPKIKSDIYNAFLSKLSQPNISKKDQKYYLKKWEKIRNEDDGRLLKDEHFYANIYRFYKKKQIVENGKVTEEFRRDMEFVKANLCKTFGNILKCLKNTGHPFSDLKVLYKYYCDWYVRSGKPSSLAPDNGILFLLLEGVQCADDVRYVDAEMKKYQVYFTNTNQRDNARKIEKKYHVSIGIRFTQENNNEMGTFRQNHVQKLHERLQSGEMTTNQIIKAVKREYLDLYGNITPSVLNSAVKAIYKNKKENSQARYSKCVKFIEDNQLEDSLTELSYSYLIHLATTFDECQHWLNKIGDTCINEILFGTIANNFIIASYDISINRKYFQKWEKIYEDLNCAYTIEDNWNTIGTYLRIEIENMLLEKPGKTLDKSSIPVVAKLLCVFYKYGRRMFNEDTYKNVSFTETIEEVEDYLRQKEGEETWKELKEYFDSYPVGNYNRMIPKKRKKQEPD